MWMLLSSSNNLPFSSLFPYSLEKVMMDGPPNETTTTFYKYKGPSKWCIIPIDGGYTLMSKWLKVGSYCIKSYFAKFRYVGNA